jgi:hypothetical protein
MADEKFDPICELEFTDAQTGKNLRRDWGRQSLIKATTVITA